MSCTYEKNKVNNFGLFLQNQMGQGFTCTREKKISSFREFTEEKGERVCRDYYIK